MVMLSVCRRDPVTAFGDGEAHTVVVPAGRKPAPAARLVSIREGDVPLPARGWAGLVWSGLVWLPWDTLPRKGTADAAALHMHEIKKPEISAYLRVTPSVAVRQE